jgi:diaminohydroxyphosphoribosylaminopyrimidine deaminase/5-amino-6-(5-phosphoribosylamino)uracil reductase
MTTEDEDWMRKALDAARKGVGKTSPNPPVGAVIVKHGTLLGTGWHRKAGLPHAEREALADALDRFGAESIRGATAYVTLEPCSTQGRTPPCTAGLIEAGIARVVYACADPNPMHAGRADAILRQAGLEVSSGVLAGEAGEILRPFTKVCRTGLPWVIWKTAMSLDGRLTRPPGEPQWLTAPEARADVQRLRAGVDAILTSGETVRRDNPRLTIREPDLLEGREQPWRVVFTEHPDSIPEDAVLLTDPWKEQTLLRSGYDLAASLRSLVARHGVLSCMTECGGKLAAALFAEGLIDEVCVYLAPLLSGGPVPALAGSGMAEPLKLHSWKFERFGDDIRLSALVASSVIA